MQYVIAVPHSVVGPRQRIDPYRNVATIMANLMLLGKSPYIYGDGQQVRCFTFIQDAIEPLVRCGFQDGLDGEVINIGPDEDFITINELFRRLAQIIGFEGEPIHVADRPREVKVAYCSAEKSRRLLGYRTTVGLDQGLTELVESIRRRGPRPFDYTLPHEIVSDKMPRTWSERLL
jgi:UDP-glucose 4-epimerase